MSGVNERPRYKYYISLTSQLPFCATPLRLDASNKCEFSCAYCFASTRQGFGRDSRLQITRPSALASRLKRINDGVVGGAIDEFLQQRVPIQFGGMSDPLSKSPVETGTTQALLTTLSDYDYPTVLSSKNAALGEPPFIDLMREGNFYVRFSTTVVDPACAAQIDRGTSQFDALCRAAEKLSHQGVPVCFRFQPIIPGHEAVATKMLESAANAGVKHVSAEYLKAPIDADVKFSAALKSQLPPRPIAHYGALGATRQGREFILPMSYRLPRLMALRDACHRHGMTFGFADNDLLIHSDGMSCCSAADLYVRDAHVFAANMVGIANRLQIGERMAFDDLSTQWSPSMPVSSFLNSKARLPTKQGANAPGAEMEPNHDEHPEWHHYLKEIWAGRLGLYAPDFFFGINDSGATDSAGLPIYERGATVLDTDQSLATQPPVNQSNATQAKTSDSMHSAVA